MHPQDKSGGEIGTPSSPEFVPLILPDAQRETLREMCLDSLHGILDDLATPDRLRDPSFTSREGEVFRRLLEALDSEEIQLPDREMRERIGRLSESYDEMEEAAEVIATHEAHHALLRVLDGDEVTEDAAAGQEESADEEDPADEDPDDGSLRQGPGWDTDDAYDSSRREVLDLLLAEAPDWLTSADLEVALAGHPATWGEKDTLEIATRSLVREGLAHRQGDLFAPTRAARQMAALGFSVG
ncbi:MAG: hypothetical protein JSU06_19275 [Actinobacteria bacterium]|nr:hypothetical protein [Actinomycetota bacterium]